MSCEGWSVGNKCIVKTAFAIVEHQMNGPDRVYNMEEPDTGVVRRIDHEHPHQHWLIVFWNRIQKTLGVPEDKFQYLEKVD